MTDRSVVGGWKNGIYLVADTPKTAIPLATESGGGDKPLLIEALKENLTHDELANLRTHLPEGADE